MIVKHTLYYYYSILSRHCHPCTEGFCFTAILSRHCHPWVLSGGLLFSSDFIETLPPLGPQWRASIFRRFYRDTATLALRASILRRFYRDTATLALRASILQRFYRDTATLGYSVEGFYFTAILSRHRHPCTEGFYFTANLLRHCHHCWALSGGLPFSSDSIETLPPLH